MKLTLLLVSYGDPNHPIPYAYINEYRVHGGKPWGLNSAFSEVILRNGKAKVEIWRTKQKKGYSIVFGAMVNGKPCSPNAKYVMGAPKDCRSLYSSFQVDISQIPENYINKFNRIDPSSEKYGPVYRLYGRKKNVW